jgi:hypothetical protein
MKKWKYTRFIFKCENPECGITWTSICKHDIYCYYCRHFGMAITSTKIEVDEKGVEKIIE